MAFNAPPVEEHPLAGIKFNHLAGGFFRPSNDGTERLAAERPEENRIISSAPLLPDYEEELDVVGVDDDDVLQVAELQEADGEDIPVRPYAQRPEDNRINTPPLLPDYEEEDEEIDVVGLGDEDLLHPAEPHRDDGIDQVRFDWPQSRGVEEREEQLNDNEALNARSPSPPQQDPAAGGPVYGHIPHGDPYAPPFAPPLAFPYAPPFVFPYAPPFAFPYAPPFAFPYAPPFAFPYASPFAFPYAPPFAFPYASPFAFPYAPPFAHPSAPPFLAPPAFINAPPEMDNAWEAEDNRTDTPVENIGLLELLSSDSSLEEDAQPSTSGLKSSTRRSREEDDEEQTITKRPRCSDDSDSD